MSRRGIDQATLTRKTGFSTGYINQILKGTNENPSLTKLEVLAAALNTSLWKLLAPPGEIPQNHEIDDCIDAIVAALRKKR